MPFQSKSQRRKFYALKAEGKMDQATIDEWEKETPDKLPEKVAEEEKRPLNTPKPSDRPGKKRMVYVRSPSGTVKTIHYGATGYKHNYSAGAKKNFRARHNCATATDKTTARYWACKDLWPSGEADGEGRSMKKSAFWRGFGKRAEALTGGGGFSGAGKGNLGRDRNFDYRAGTQESHGDPDDETKASKELIDRERNPRDFQHGQTGPEFQVESNPHIRY